MSMKEHHRRQVERWLDTINGKWRLRAACLLGVPGVETPDMCAEGLEEQREAAKFCHAFCPVREECLEHARNTGEPWYVWGGTTSTEREHLMKKDRQDRRDSA